MTRIAFTADWHIDSYGAKVDPMTGLNARLVDFLRTAEWLAHEAENRDCAGLVVAGDLTERRHPAPWLVARIRQALDEFAGGRQVLLRGNHDGEIADRSIVDVLEGGIRLGITRPRNVLVGDVVLSCIPHVDRHWLRAQPGFEHVPDAEVFGILAEQIVTIARGLYAEAQEHLANRAHVLVLHQTLAGALMSETQRAFLGDLQTVVDAVALGAIGFEAVIAGHLHRHQVVVDGPCPVIYPGSIERVDFGEEHERKGFIVADVAPGQFVWEFVETPARRFFTLDLDASPETVPIGGAQDAIVRILNVPPETDAAALRRAFEEAGAFEIAEIRRRPAEASAIAGGLAETLTPEEALDAFFADEPDRDALVERGRQILAEVRS